MMLHNGMLASPLNPITKACKKITAKKSKKTERDNELLAELETVGSLYIARTLADGTMGDLATVQVDLGETSFEFGLIGLDDNGREDKRLPLEPIKANQIVLPAINLEALINRGARRSRKGKDVVGGITVPGNYRIRHRHEKHMVEDLLQDFDFVDQRLVKVQANRIMRARPKLHDWSIDFLITYQPTVISHSEIETYLEDAARYVGCGDFTPKFGKFIVQKFEALD